MYGEFWLITVFLRHRQSSHDTHTHTHTMKQLTAKLELGVEGEGSDYLPEVPGALCAIVLM